MPDAYDYVAKAEELAASGRLADAERAFKQAIRAYEKAGDREGVFFALGRLGAAFEDAGEDGKALAVYRQAVKLGTDIPATLSSAISLLVDYGELDEAFAVAGDWDRRGHDHARDTAFAEFIGLGDALSRDGQHNEAIALLQRTVNAISPEEHSEKHWLARGVLGQAVERSGDLDLAMRLYAEAVEAGSTDKNTFDRYLINLERRKEYDTELRVIEQALQIQHEAAWELDLRKRQQRVLAKLGRIPKEESKKVIPVFSVRFGAANISLAQQVKLPLQVGSLAVWGNTAYVATGGKSPALSAWSIDSSAQAWRVPMPETVHGVLAAEGAVIAYEQSGPVGACETTLRFYTDKGEPIAIAHLPDAPSQMVVADDLLYAGCRDGKLYALTLRGENRWSYVVPGSTGSFDSPYVRPCPYLVKAGNGLVIFSSWNNVYVLTNRGQIAWNWAIPQHRTSSTVEGVTVSITSGPDSVRTLALAPDGKRALVAAGTTLYLLESGNVVNRFLFEEGTITDVEFLDGPGDWILGSGTNAIIYRSGVRRARIAIPEYARFKCAVHQDLVVASMDRLVAIATTGGKRIAEIEFAKSVVDIGFTTRGQLVIGAGQMVVLNIVPGVSAMAQESEKRNVSPKPKTAKQPSSVPLLRPNEEQGLPVRWVEGMKQAGTSGKALYQGQNSRLVTIEQLALEHYDQIGYKGLWSENEYWWTITSLLYWDVLFARLPGVFSPEMGAFPGPLQDMPRDLFSDQFFPRRQDLILRREGELSQASLFGMRKPNPEAELRDSFRRHHGLPCRPVNWERFTIDELIWGARKLTPVQLVRIMRRLLENFNDHRRGLPDLFTWRGDQPLLVEVKSSGEQLSDAQRAWLSFLQSDVRVPVEICRVAEHGVQ